MFFRRYPLLLITFAAFYSPAMARTSPDGNKASLTPALFTVTDTHSQKWIKDPIVSRVIENTTAITSAYDQNKEPLANCDASKSRALSVVTLTLQKNFISNLQTRAGVCNRCLQWSRSQACGDKQPSCVDSDFRTADEAASPISRVLVGKSYSSVGPDTPFDILLKGKWGNGKSSAHILVKVVDADPTYKLVFGTDADPSSNAVRISANDDSAHMFSCRQSDNATFVGFLVSYDPTRPNQVGSVNIQLVVKDVASKLSLPIILDPKIHDNQ